MLVISALDQKCNDYRALLHDNTAILENHPSGCRNFVWAHLLAYALLGAVAHWDSRRIELKRYVVLIAIVLPILYGGALELVQELWFYPRTGDWLDWAVDAIGVVLGYSLISIALCTYQKLMNPTDE